MESNMTFLCDMWRFSAEEYMAFLNRYDIKCLGIHVIFRDKTVIFVDEEKYLDLSLNNNKFAEAEKQIIKLLERSEKLISKFTELATKKFGSEEIPKNESEQEYDDSFRYYDEEE